MMRILMGYDVDFLPVGQSTKSGDAIAFRYGNLYGDKSEQIVNIIDAGTQEAAVALVEHVRDYYHTDFVDNVFVSHSDFDHSSGIPYILENIGVGTVYMHLPWMHAGEIHELFEDSRMTVNSLKNKLQKSLDQVKEIETISVKKGIQVVEPFSGLSLNDNSLLVLGPTQDYYEYLLPQFRSTPPSKAQDFFEQVRFKAAELVEWIEETLDISSETLDRFEKKTSPENLSSTILLLNLPQHKILFTGDSGIEPLKEALKSAAYLNIDLSSIALFQVPHHGSKRNIDSELLNSMSIRTACISAASKNDNKHPSKHVVNALIRRGGQVCATQGKTIRHYFDAPPRNGWVDAEQLSFSSHVEGIDVS